jgi:hypothetical protein
MSRRLFTTPRDDVLTGGDRPFQSLFLVITDRHTREILINSARNIGVWALDLSVIFNSPEVRHGRVYRPCRYPKFAHSIGFSGGVRHRSSKAS